MEEYEEKEGDNNHILIICNNSENAWKDSIGINTELVLMIIMMAIMTYINQRKKPNRSPD